MEKPSRFITQKKQQSNYQKQKFYKIKLSERFYFSHAIHRIQKWTIHNGIDLKTKDQVIIASSFAKQRNNQNQYKKISELCSILLLEGQKNIEKAKYKLKIYKKTGCMFEQFLNYFDTISMKTFELIVILFINFIIKIHQLRANIKCLDEKVFHLTVDPNDEFLKLEICHPNLIQFRQKYDRKSMSIRPLQNRIFQTQLSPKRKSSFFLQKINVKPSYERDIQLIHQKILQISGRQKQISLTIEKKQDFLIQIKFLLKKVVKSIQKKQQPQIWIKILSQFATSRLVNLKQQRIQAKQIIQEIKIKNYKKSSSLCSQLMTRKVIQQHDISDFSQSEPQFIDQNEIQCQDQIQKQVINHTFMVSLKRQFINQK